MLETEKETGGRCEKRKRNTLTLEREIFEREGEIERLHGRGRSRRRSRSRVA